MDETFLRQAAALQANLKMLESQSASLTDLADMKELRQFKARLADYIDGHAAAGNLPRDPFQVIEGRLRALEDFFSATTRETKRLTSWRKDWTKAAPSVDLATLQGALGELDAMVAEVPRIQESLRAKVSVLDWVVRHHAVELHQELLICASCVSGLELQKPARRQAAYDFTNGSGSLANEVAKHFQEVGTKILEWISLHANHSLLLLQIENHIENHEVSSAEIKLNSLHDFRFLDLDYRSPRSNLAKLNAIISNLIQCNDTIDDLSEEEDFISIEKELERIGQSITKAESELGQGALPLLAELKISRDEESKISCSTKRMLILAATFSILAWLTLILSAWQSASILITGIAATAAITSGVYIIKIKRDQVKIKKNYKISRSVAFMNAKQRLNRAGEEHEFEVAPGLRITFCWCPSGEFLMGNLNDGKSGCGNQVKVTLSKGFWISKTQVTQLQWEAVMGNNPSRFEGEDNPIENVSWHDTHEFLDKISFMVSNTYGGKMGLPTEAQWEYAARAGQSEIYSGGSLDDVAWYAENSENETNPVGQKMENAWGLHDMSGNVWEWCQDWYREKLEGGLDPRGPDSGTAKVIRGGSWSAIAKNCRVTARSLNAPSEFFNVIGFRIVHSLTP